MKDYLHAKLRMSRRFSRNQFSVYRRKTCILAFISESDSILLVVWIMGIADDRKWCDIDICSFSCWFSEMEDELYRFPHPVLY